MRKAADKRRLQRWGNPCVNRCSDGSVCIKFDGQALANTLFKCRVDERGRAYVNGVRLPPLFRKHERHWEKRELTWKLKTVINRFSARERSGVLKYCVACGHVHDADKCAIRSWVDRKSGI